MFEALADSQRKGIYLIKQMYADLDIQRTFRPTKDGYGVYVHPKSKGDSFLKVGKKRVGIFVNTQMTSQGTLDYLRNTDPEFEQKWNEKHGFNKSTGKFTRQ